MPKQTITIPVEVPDQWELTGETCWSASWTIGVARPHVTVDLPLRRRWVPPKWLPEGWYLFETLYYGWKISPNEPQPIRGKWVCSPGVSLSVELYLQAIQARGQFVGEEFTPPPVDKIKVQHQREPSVTRTKMAYSSS